MDTTQDEGHFQVAVGAIIENTHNGKILLIKRSESSDSMPNVWEFPMGRLKQGETPENGLKREVKEEVGLEIVAISPVRTFHFYRGEEKMENELIGISFWAETDTDKVILSTEHTEYKWMDPKEALNFVENPGVKKDIENYLHEKKIL